MKRVFSIIIFGVIVLLTCQEGVAQKKHSPFVPIKVKTPSRPAGQEDVIQLVAPKMDTVRVGFIGLGMRGVGAVERWIHIPNYLKRRTGKEVKDFQNGDQTTTMIRTENERTMLIQHNVMTPRPYSRMYQVVGTDGYASKYPVSEYCLRPSQVSSTEIPDHENLNAHGAVPAGVKKALMAKYKSPILDEELEETAKKVGGHGGMDYIMDYRLVYCLRNGLPLDMDVYDLAEWCCMAELTRLSIENNSAPVEVPDFTRGGWNRIEGYRHAFAK